MDYKIHTKFELNEMPHLDAIELFHMYTHVLTYTYQRDIVQMDLM